MKRHLFPAMVSALLLFQNGNTQNTSPYWSLAGNSNTATTSKLGTTNNVSLRFYAGNVQRMMIGYSSGNVAIGTTSLNARLTVNAAAGSHILLGQVDGTTKLFAASNGGLAVGSEATPPSDGLFVRGFTGIGIITPATRLQVTGASDVSLSGGGNITSGSIGGANIVISDKEIMARSNGTPATLTLNNEGGNVVFNGTNAGDGSHVGINTASPGSDLHIAHTNGFVSNGLTLKNTYAAGLSWNIYSATTGELWFAHDGTRRGTIDGTSGAYTASSDKRLKKDVTSMESVLDKVLKLQPKRYNFNTQTQSLARKYIGFIAQEVQPVFPEAVYEHNGSDGADDYLSLDYATFGVISIKAIQEQQQTIVEQQEKINSLEDRINKLETLLAKGNGAATSAGAYLEQNSPNPASGITAIRYHVPAGAGTAKLTITNAKGQLVKTMNLTNKGKGQVNFDTTTLAAGTYNYTLWVENGQAGTKRLIIAR